jgi:hypothetical protein
MKYFANSLQRNLLLFAALMCVLATTPVFAVSDSETFTLLTNQTVSGPCCSTFGGTIYVTEPAKINPIVVTWSTDYVNSNPENFIVGLSLNGSACTLFGPGQLTPFWTTSFTNVTFQWVVLPQDGLIVGNNSFTLCAGSTNGANDSITIGYNSLIGRVVGISPSQVKRVTVNQTFTGKCCFSFNETVQITEPTSIVPVEVTWSFDSISSGQGDFVGLSVNGGPCNEHWEVAVLNGSLAGSTAEAILSAGDGLVSGKNTISLCGGGVVNTDSITLGFNTLAVRIKN